MGFLQMKLDINLIPGCAALVFVKKDDICLLEAGKRYKECYCNRELMGRGVDFCGQSVFQGFSETERIALCSSIWPKVRKKQDFQYSRKAVYQDGRTCWLQVQAVYMETVNGDSVYVATVMDITDSILTRMQLEESARSLETANREMETILRTVFDGVAKVIPEDGYPVIFANHAFYHMIGYTREQFESECANRLGCLNVSDELLVSGKVKEQRWQYRTREGKCCWSQVYMSHAEMTYGDGKGKQPVYVAFTDISHAVEREEQLNREIYYQSLIDKYSPAATLIRSAVDLRPLYLTKSAANYFDYSQKEIYRFSNGKKHEVVHPDDYREVITPITERRDDYDYSKEYRVLKKDGTYDWCYEITRLEQREGEEPVYISSFMNTTELKKTQEQVRIREEEYKVLVKRSGKIVYRYNIRDKKIEFPMGTEFLSNLVDYNGSYAENVIQAGFVANESETEFRQFCDGISHGKTEGSAKIKSRRKNDGYKWYQCQYTTIYDNDGAPVSAIITLEDITSQQQAEAELKILRKEQELLSVITAHTDRKLFRYDIGLRKAVMGNTVAEEWGIPCDVDETLCEFLPYDILSPESIRDYERMMRDIHYGAKGRVVIRIKTSNLGWRLYQMDYTTVKGQDGAPEYAIISYQNVQEQYIDRVTHAMIWEIFKLIPSGRYLVIHGLLSDNVVETLRGDLFNIKARHMHCVSLDEIAQWISRTRIHEEDRERWDRYHNRNWLLYVFDKDVHCLNQWYRLCPDCLEDGTGLIQELIILVKSPYTENVYASSVLWIKDTMIEQKTFSLNDTIWESERLSGTRSERARKAEDTPHRIHIRTFGYFDVFVDGQILDFTSRKGKELLAILVDRNGGVCTSEDIISMLWENEPMSRTISSRYRQTVKRLKRFLDEAGIGDILVSKKGGKCVDTTRFTCDFYEYLKGNTHYRKMFHHLYMTNYSWGGEYTCSTICHERRLEK